MSLSLLVSQEAPMGLQKYESHVTFGVAPHTMCACCLPRAWVKPELHVEKKLLVSFFLISLVKLTNKKGATVDNSF